MFSVSLVNERCLTRGNSYNYIFLVRNTNYRPLKLPNSCLMSCSDLYACFFSSFFAPSLSSPSFPLFIFRFFSGINWVLFCFLSRATHFFFSLYYSRQRLQIITHRRFGYIFYVLLHHFHYSLYFFIYFIYPFHNCRSFQLVYPFSLNIFQLLFLPISLFSLFLHFLLLCSFTLLSHFLYPFPFFFSFIHFFLSLKSLHSTFSSPSVLLFLFRLRFFHYNNFLGQLSHWISVLMSWTEKIFNPIILLY